MPWQTMTNRGKPSQDYQDSLVQLFERYGMTRRNIKRRKRDFSRADIWANDIYEAEVRTRIGIGPYDDPPETYSRINAKTSWLSIKRYDRQPIKDWRDLQAIKNDICGPEAEGLEIYPAESRKVDMANQYHMFVVYDGHVPFGFNYGKPEVDYDGHFLKKNEDIMGTKGRQREVS